MLTFTLKFLFATTLSDLNFVAFVVLYYKRIQRVRKGMTVYADVLICVNFIIDYFLVGITAKIVKAPCSFARQIISALVGGACSLVILLPKQNTLVSLLLLFFTSALIVFVAFGKSGIKAFFRSLACFYLASFLFTGAMSALSKFINNNTLAVRNGMVYYNLSAIFLIAFSVITYLIITLFCRYVKRNNPPTCKLEISQDNVQLNVTALVDSGNRLQEPFSEKWVMLLDSGYEKLFGEIKAPRRVIPYSTVAGEGVLYGFYPQSINLKPSGQKLDMYVAFSPKPLKNGYRAIISSEAL